MLNVIGEIIPEAIAIAFNPVVIAGVILILMSQHGRSKAIAYLTGWMVGLTLLSVTIYWLMWADAGTSWQMSPRIPGFQLFLGAGFLLMAIYQLRHIPRQKPDHPPHYPWIDRLDGLTMAKALGLATALASLNVKNAGLILSASYAFRVNNLHGLRAWIILAVFIGIGSLPLAVPIMYEMYNHSKAEKRLQDWRDWLLINNALVLFVLFLILGAKLIGAGLAGF